MTEPKVEPTASPILRLGIAVFFLCCASLAIVYAWFEFERAEVQRQEKKRMEESSMNITSEAESSKDKSP